MLRVKNLFYFLFFWTTRVACGDVEDLIMTILCIEMYLL